jgi:LPXTG-site transpeptidase (sortase) family protein
MKRSVLSRRWFRTLLYVIVFAGLGTASWPFGQVALGWWNQRTLRQQWNEQVQNEQARSKQERDEQAVEVAFKKAQSALSKSLPHRSQVSNNKATAPIVVKRVKAKAVKAKAVKARWLTTRLIIPSIDVDAIVLRGVDDDALEKGPGHDPASSLPGQKGNCVIAAHRNAYGWWFYNLGELGSNAQIELRTPSASYHYKVVSTQVLPDNATWVLQPPANPKAAPRLTLYTCALPRGSKRIVVTAVYTGQKQTTS